MSRLYPNADERNKVSNDILYLETEHLTFRTKGKPQSSTTRVFVNAQTRSTVVRGFSRWLSTNQTKKLSRLSAILSNIPALQKSVLEVLPEQRTRRLAHHLGKTGHRQLRRRWRIISLDMHEFQPVFGVCGICGREFAEARCLGAQVVPGGDEDALPEAWKDQGTNNDETYVDLEGPVVDGDLSEGKGGL